AAAASAALSFALMRERSCAMSSVFGPCNGCPFQAAAERCQRMADLAARLDTTLQEQGGSAAKATTDPTC
ncbi:hypothetical protein, partial [Aeromonas caviae]|uniref:hypothetical protein n=1 Tax=Aeromonas caviae TaxID=648 RepID=UPI001CC36EBF